MMHSFTLRSNYLIFLISLFSISMWAQQTSVSGTIKDKGGNPLIGANIQANNSANGTVTDLDGKFELQITENDQTLIFSYVGYETQRVAINNQSRFEITLQESVTLDEVVVTALGVKRSEKALGYSVQKLGNEDINRVRSTNVVNALTGKLAGVNILGNTSGPTASSSVIIRGESSLTGNNQALFVVNGIPITNGLFSSGDGLNGSSTIDFGNSAQIVNPDDIESVNVLKGPAAAALYGTRASNGVILITTKTGANAQGWGISVNSNLTFESILKLPDYQDEYGFGGYGKYSYRDGTTYTGDNGVDFYDGFGENWGPRMDGTPIRQFGTGTEPTPFVPFEDNIRDFYRTGFTATNNIAIANSGEDGDFRFSFTNLSNEGIVPNTGLQRNTVNLSIGKQFLNGFNFRLNGFYINSSSDNIPNAGYDESSSVTYTFVWFPRNQNINNLRDYWVPGLEGIQQRNFEELWTNNPYFLVNENTNSFVADRVIGNVELSYDFNPALRARVRIGGDVKNEDRAFRRAFSTKSVPFGSYREDKLKFYEYNIEGLLSYQRPDVGDFGYGLKLGANLMRQNSSILNANAPQLLLPGVYNLGNARSNVIVDQFKYNKQINSVFAIANFSYKNFLYLDVTGRNDWSSTLPVDNNSYFYPSVSLSGIISELFNLPTTSVLSFAKVRAAYAQVGGDTDPYRIRNVFEFQNSWGGQAAAAESPSLNNADLRPERTSSTEFGVDLRFLNNRLRLDATYYDISSKDQILFVPITVTSGYQSRLLNAGEIENKGVEIILGAQPVVQPGFSWDVTLNFARNRSRVVSLTEGIQNYQIISDAYPADFNSADLSLEARPGEPLGQLVGLGFQRDDEGNIIHENGLPLYTTEKVSAGTYQPDFTAGVYNQFNLGNFSLGFLFDGRFGGKIYSRTHLINVTSGSITNADNSNLKIETTDGRIEYDVSYNSAGLPIYDLIDEGGVVGPGVKYDAEGNLVPNDVPVPSRDYFYAYFGNGFQRDNIEASVFDASFVKLREVRLAYQFPTKVLERLGLTSASIALVGRNLLLFSDTPSIDPEAYSIRGGQVIQGFESTQLPPTRSWGVNLNVNF